MNDDHCLAIIHQNLGAKYYFKSVNGDEEGREPLRLELYQRYAATHYSLARRFMGLEGRE